MFSLIMSSNVDEWKYPVGHEGFQTFSLSRFLEYTDDEIVERFQPITTDALTSLAGLPTVFMSELTVDVSGSYYLELRVGHV